MSLNIDLEAMGRVHFVLLKLSCRVNAEFLAGNLKFEDKTKFKKKNIKPLESQKKNQQQQQ
jgi:hypothetical protein